MLGTPGRKVLCNFRAVGHATDLLEERLDVLRLKELDER
jgi:hypothetical protein